MYAELWLSTPHYHPWTYQVPQNLPVNAGDLVVVPFGKRQSLGLVVEVFSQKPKGIQNFRTIQEVLPLEFRLSAPVLQLMVWAQKHYLAPPGEVLKTFLPNSILKGKKTQGERSQTTHHSLNFNAKKHPNLNPPQVEIIQEVLKNQQSFYPLLLWGITGSGKTEVYLELCEKLLEQKKSSLILVPEISLTPQTLARFAAYFGDQVQAYHSSMTEAQRLKAYYSIKKGEKKIVVGTRSAVALPLDNLGLVVVDEEHDPSYKQEERFKYHARDLAVMRAKLEKVPIVLGSATPSLESYLNVQKQKYHLAQLKTRATGGNLPKLNLLDLKKHPPHPKTFLSEVLKEKLEHTLKQNKQALFFLGRRGLAPFLLCLDCGESPGCSQCSVSLSLHKNPPTLQCHYCVTEIPVPSRCPQCNSPRLRPMGQGTEKIEEALCQAFPGVKVGRLDRDIIRQRKKTEEVLADFAQGKLKILVGTQMITKGHDFPNLTLVGVLLADLNLNFPDFRAAERCYQTLVQVSGRAGRHESPGEVYIQTYRPYASALKAVVQADPQDFYEQELKFRSLAHYPPYKRLVLIRLLGPEKEKLKIKAEEILFYLKKRFASNKQLTLLGPAPSPLEKIRGQYRYHLLIKSNSYEMVQRELLPRMEEMEKILNPSMRLQVDVDPLSLF